MAEQLPLSLKYVTFFDEFIEYLVGCQLDTLAQSVGKDILTFETRTKTEHEILSLSFIYIDGRKAERIFTLKKNNSFTSTLGGKA